MHLSIQPIISLRNNNGRRQDSPFRGTTCKFKVQGALPLLNTRPVHRRTFTQCEGLTLAHHLQ